MTVSHFWGLMLQGWCLAERSENLWPSVSFWILLLLLGSSWTMCSRLNSQHGLRNAVHWCIQVRIAGFTLSQGWSSLQSTWAASGEGMITWREAEVPLSGEGWRATGWQDNRHLSHYYLPHRFIVRANRVPIGKSLVQGQVNGWLRFRLIVLTFLFFPTSWAIPLSSTRL